MPGPLSDEQIENWRKSLISQFGPYALIMPKEQIVAYRDRLEELAQKIADEEDDEDE